MRDHRHHPAFVALQTLFLVLHDATVPLADGDRCRLASRLREGTVTAAASLVHAWHLPAAQRRSHLASAAGTLREVGYLVDLALRLRYVELGTAQELMELQTRARLELDRLLRPGEDEETDPTIGPAAPTPVPLIAALDRG